MVNRAKRPQWRKSPFGYRTRFRARFGIGPVWLHCRILKMSITKDLLLLRSQRAIWRARRRRGMPTLS